MSSIPIDPSLNGDASSAELRGNPIKKAFKTCAGLQDLLRAGRERFIRTCDSKSSTPEEICRAFSDRILSHVHVLTWPELWALRERLRSRPALCESGLITLAGWRVQGVEIMIPPEPLIDRLREYAEYEEMRHRAQCFMEAAGSDSSENAYQAMTAWALQHAPRFAAARFADSTEVFLPSKLIGIAEKACKAQLPDIELDLRTLPRSAFLFLPTAAAADEGWNRFFEFTFYHHQLPAGFTGAFNYTLTIRLPSAPSGAAGAAA